MLYQPLLNHLVEAVLYVVWMLKRVRKYSGNLSTVGFSVLAT